MSPGRAYRTAHRKAASDRDQPVLRSRAKNRAFTRFVRRPVRMIRLSFFAMNAVTALATQDRFACKQDTPKGDVPGIGFGGGGPRVFALRLPPLRLYRRIGRKFADLVCFPSITKLFIAHSERNTLAFGRQALGALRWHFRHTYCSGSPLFLALNPCPKPSHPALIR